MSDTSIENKTDKPSVNNPAELVVVASRGSQGTKPKKRKKKNILNAYSCLLYTSPSPRDGLLSRMPSSA